MNFATKRLCVLFMVIVLGGAVFAASQAPGQGSVPVNIDPQNDLYEFAGVADQGAQAKALVETAEWVQKNFPSHYTTLLLWRATWGDVITVAPAVASSDMPSDFYLYYDSMWAKAFFTLYMDHTFSFKDHEFIVPDKQIIESVFYECGLRDLFEKIDVIGLFSYIGKEMMTSQLLLFKYLLLADYLRALKSAQTIAIEVLIVEADRSFDTLINKILQNNSDALDQVGIFRERIKM